MAVVGGGPAGLAAAVAAREAGAASVVILEREACLGGILPQCIHTGFGLARFGEDLTGPEYAERYAGLADGAGVGVLLGTTVLGLEPGPVLRTVNPSAGLFLLRAQGVVLAMGCRERTRVQAGIGGTRPAGVFTAGVAQRYLNIEGRLPGQTAVIVGSGDVGLLLARRLTLCGARVAGVYEQLPYASGLTRNVVQCLHDFDIPLHLSHTVLEVHGRGRVEAVTVAQVADGRPVPGSETAVPCDTLIVSVGLIPENELTRGAGARLDPATGGPAVDSLYRTTLPGVYACGNVVHVHDLVDHVSAAAAVAGADAARPAAGPAVPIVAGDNVRYVVPQRLVAGAPARVYCRVVRPQRDVELAARCGSRVIARRREAAVRPPELLCLDLPTQSPGKLTGPVVVDCRPREVA